VIQAASDKDGAEANFKGYGFHPLTAWCSNVGDALAAMLRPGSAGSFTAADHIAVVDSAIAQLPPGWRTDVLVAVDGAGASHGLVDHFTGLNTAARHGRRGRRVEYSIGWPLDARTRAAIDTVGETDWTPGLSADGKTDDKAQVVDLTGLLRHSVGGDQLGGWPADMRVFARRTPRAPGEQAELGGDANWRYGAFATNTTTGQVAWLDARHRTQAHVEDKIKETKACGAERLGLQGLQPQQCLTPTGHPGRLPAGLATPDRPGRRPGPGRTQNVAVPPLLRPRPTRRPRPPPRPENPTRLGLGRTLGQRLDPQPRPAPRLNTTPPS
jgi:hypothetical protein